MVLSPHTMGCWSIFPWQTDGVEVAQRHQEILQAIEKQEAGRKKDCMEPRKRSLHDGS
jgi:hypothetical protein